MILKRAITIGCTFTALLFWNVQAKALTFEFDTARPSVILGDMLSVDLVVSGLGEYGPDSLGTFDLEIIYDSSVLAFSGYELGGFLGDTFFGEAISLGEWSSGQVNIAEESLLDADKFSGPAYFGPYLDEIQPGSFTLATLSFDTIALGKSTLNLGYSTFGDGFGNPLTLENNPFADITVSAAPVPEPASILLFSTGLAGLATTLRKRKNKNID